MTRLARELTAGETAMASRLFGDAIDYTCVRVRKRRYLPLLQPKRCAMTPDGSIDFHHSRFLPTTRPATRPSSTGSCTRSCVRGGLHTTWHDLA